jgi:hypothetical protein
MNLFNGGFMSYNAKFLFAFCAFMLAGSLYAADVWSPGKRNLSVSDLTQARQGLVELQKTIRTFSSGVSAGQYSVGYLRKLLANEQYMHNPYHFMDTTTWNGIAHKINALDAFLSIDTQRAVAQEYVYEDCHAIDMACEQGKKEIDSRITAFGDYARTKAHTIANPAQLTSILNRFRQKQRAQSRTVPSSPAMQNSSPVTQSRPQTTNQGGDSTNHDLLTTLHDAGWSSEKITEFNTLVEACKRNATQESMQALGTFIQGLSETDRALVMEILPQIMEQAENDAQYDKGFFSMLKENPKMFALLALGAAAFIAWRIVSPRDPGATFGNWIRSFFSRQPAQPAAPAATIQSNANQQVPAPEVVESAGQNREQDPIGMDGALDNQSHQQHPIPYLDPLVPEEAVDHVQEPQVASAVDQQSINQEPVQSQPGLFARASAWISNYFDPVTDKAFALDRI